VEAIVRGVADPVGTARGAAELSSYLNPSFQSMRIRNQFSGGSYFDPLFTNDNGEDFEQATEIAGIIPFAKPVKAIKVAKNVASSRQARLAANILQNFAAESRQMGIVPRYPSIRGLTEDIPSEEINDATEALIRRVSSLRPVETQASREALAREMSGVATPVFETVRMTGRALRDATTGGLSGVIEPRLKSFGRSWWDVVTPSGTPSQQRAAIEKATAEAIEQTNVGTIRGRQAAELEPINRELEEAGFDPLPGINEARLQAGIDTMAKPQSPSTYNRATVERNVDVATQTHGSAAGFTDISRVADPTQKAHIMENDHLIGTGFATWFIKQTKPEVITQDWRDETAAFIEWINSGDNMQRVGRLWNQFKNGQNFDVAMKDFKEQYSKAAEGQFIDPYLEYVENAMRSFKSTMGSNKAKEIIDAWKSEDWAKANAGIQAERQDYIIAARSMRDKAQGYQALVDRGFDEDEAARIIYSR
jgi:hypothetical protein